MHATLPPGTQVQPLTTCGYMERRNMITATDTLAAIMEKIDSCQFDEALAALDGVPQTDENRNDLLFLRGYLQERQSDKEAAYATYSSVLDEDPDHVEAAFRSAQLCDQSGDDDAAIELYERCADRKPAHVNALVNLAVLYEQAGQFSKAEKCLQDVINENPNHWRAEHFLKSVQSSYTMIYDERSQDETERHNELLDMPISDFELSVRSRNCLRQMNIRTLSDLLKTTEAELLSYKNFGETSLCEIKAMLTQKNLRLGQGMPAAEIPAMGPAPVASSNESPHSQRSVSELELSVRSRKALQRLGISTLGELAARSEAELMTVKNFGQTSMIEIKRELTKFGLSFQTSPG